jgi:hypothetical protein
MSTSLSGTLFNWETWITGEKIVGPWDSHLNRFDCIIIYVRRNHRIEEGRDVKERGREIETIINEEKYERKLTRKRERGER